MKILREKYPVGNTLYRATMELELDKAEATDLLCPSCPDGKLVSQKIRGVELEWCDRCRGIFLDQGEKDRLLGFIKKARARKKPITPSFDSPVDTAGATDALMAGGIVGALVEIVADIFD
jgi:Zn-finger nucleic acid-binding protein